VDFQTLKSVKWVVVLGGGSAVDPRLPASTYLSAASLFRLSEAIRIHNRLPQTKLIFSGRSGLAGVTPVAEIMAETAAEFGARPEKIIIEADSADTKDHPIYLKKIIGSDQFLLVSSASHMPRAVALFRKQGMRPIPAPTNYRAMQRQRSIPLLGLLPRPGPLAESNQAIHEYLGILWAKFRGLL